MRKFSITVNGQAYEVEVEEIGGAPVFAPAPAPAYAPAEQNWEELPQEQKDELLSILEDKLAAERQLIEKSAEYGILPQEKAQKILERRAERLEEAKTEGVFPKKERR